MTCCSPIGRSAPRSSRRSCRRRSRSTGSTATAWLGLVAFLDVPGRSPSACQRLRSWAGSASVQMSQRTSATAATAASWFFSLDAASRLLSGRRGEHLVPSAIPRGPTIESVTRPASRWYRSSTTGRRGRSPIRAGDEAPGYAATDCLPESPVQPATRPASRNRRDPGRPRSSLFATGRRGGLFRAASAMNLAAPGRAAGLRTETLDRRGRAARRPSSPRDPVGRALSLDGRRGLGGSIGGRREASAPSRASDQDPGTEDRCGRSAGPHALRSETDAVWSESKGRAMAGARWRRAPSRRR